MASDKVRQIVKHATYTMVAGLFFWAAWYPATAVADDFYLAAAREIKQRLEPRLMYGFPYSHAEDLDACDALVRFYRARRYTLAWVDRHGLLPEAALALSVLRQAGRQGLYAADYRDPWVDDLLQGTITRPVVLGAAFEGKQVQLDLALTDLVLRYAYHRDLGRIALEAIPESGTAPHAQRRDLATELARGLDEGRLAQFFEGLGPRHAAYRQLRKSLPRYQNIRETGGWPTIDEGPKLKSGDCGFRVAQLRDRLGAAEDAHPASASAEICFDADLEAAVARFQRRHGLTPDGIAGDRTLAALNVPVEDRIRQIQLNLERWRWMPEELGARYVMVNIPAFEMQVVEAGKRVKTLRTIVGQEERPTPVISSTITYLEINPYWHVPATIAGKDLLPKIQADASYLTRQNFRVFEGWGKDAREIDPLAVNWAAYSEDYFPLRLRQEPAGGNALGRVKIMFPNDASVYIHDTPAKGLFNRTSRPFSSGCVRVENPLELVRLLLDRQGWDEESLVQAVASQERQVVVLDEPVPVYIVYRTAWAEAGGEVQFRDDIYGRDRTLLQAMTAGPAVPITCQTVRPRQPTYLGDYHDGGPRGVF